MKLYKIVSTKYKPLHGGSGTWFAPTKTKPGKWMPKIENVEACKRGYHLIPAKAIAEWLPPSGIVGYLCEAEGRGAQNKGDDKIAFAQARLLKIIGLLDEKSMRLAAADMAERVLPIFYKVRPNDDRPAKAIQAARYFALGKIDAAARTAAGDAAWAAAGDAARTAARDAAWAAARDAAWAAAEAAAWDAARDAAWAAAGAAAWDAARTTAWDAARAAAWDANAKIIIAQAKRRLLKVAK